MELQSLLLVAPDEETRRLVRAILEYSEYPVVDVGPDDLDEVLRQKTAFGTFLILEGGGLARTVRRLRQEEPVTPILLLRRREMKDPLPTAVENEISASLDWPTTYPVLTELLQRLLRERGKPKRKRSLELFRSLTGDSQAIRKTRKLLEQVADTEVTVLILGESGTGKEVVARNLHYRSSRRNKPFVPVNCGAIPGELLESELFGHEKGAFTGALSARQGRFEMAEGGTLFLDEIGEISLAVQVKLLNVIQERTFQRLGSARTIKTNIRLVAATNRDLEKAVKEMKFREDLYYRLNVFPIYLPPLRERRTDILLLAEYFLEKYARENKKKIRRISTSAIDLLVQYHWPGNVRELQNCIERAVLICDDQTIKSIHLPPSLQSADSVRSSRPLSLAAAVENFERELIIEALKKNKGNQTRAAQYLDTSLRIINYKIHNYGIDPRQFKVK